MSANNDYDGWAGHAVLQVSVPQLEEFVVGRTRFYDERMVSADPEFVHAHVTIIAPLLTWDTRIFTQMAQSVEPFEFQLNSIRVFDDGLIYLAPDPDDELRRLCAVARRCYPDLTTFGGPHPTPHVTLDLINPRASLESTKAGVLQYLPASCRADALDLVWYGINSCRLIERFPLGQG